MEHSRKKASGDTSGEISIYTIIGLCGNLVGIILIIVNMLSPSIVLGLCVALVFATSFVTSAASITHKNNNNENRRLSLIGIIIPLGMLLVLSLYYFIHYGV